jgi:Ni/Fe-hydrogenase subunit HybB-like protein
MWLLGGAPILILVLGSGMVAFGAAVSWVAFRTRRSFAIATGLAASCLALGALAWWRGIEEHHPLAAVPFQIAAGITIGAGLVIVLGELARGRREPDDDDRWPPT